MDIADQAQQFEQINLDQSLKAQREVSKYTPRPSPRGYCLNQECGEPFGADSSDRLYCGPICAERHEKQSRLKSQRY